MMQWVRAWLLILPVALWGIAHGAPTDVPCSDTVAEVGAPLLRQRLAVHAVGTERRVEEFLAPTNAVGELHPTVVRALHVANQRFVETRPGGDPQLVFTRQKGVDARTTRYFVLKGANAEVTGLGLLLDGTATNRCQVEKEFPGLDLRRRPDANGPVELMEVARLATAAGEKGGLNAIFAGMAAHIAERYGGADKVPANLRIVLWTSVEKLTDVYRDRYGFEVWESPPTHGQPDKWVMGMSGQAFVERYLAL